MSENNIRVVIFCNHYLFGVESEQGGWTGVSIADFFLRGREEKEEIVYKKLEAGRYKIKAEYTEYFTPEDSILRSIVSGLREFRIYEGISLLIGLLTGFFKVYKL